MTELMVVIGIIAVLAGILLVAMGGVRERAKYTRALARMDEFAKACEAFQIEHGQYPGVIPDPVLAEQASLGSIKISGSENAMLHMMGGYRVVSPFDPPGGQAETEANAYAAAGSRVLDEDIAGWRLVVDVDRIGEGPVIDGKPYPPYYTPAEGAIEVAWGQVDQSTEDEFRMPDPVDPWGQPIVYARRARTTGPLMGTFATNPPPQFYFEPIAPYVRSVVLGRLRKDQTHTQYGTILDPNNADGMELEIAAQMIRHPAFGPRDDPLNGTPRGGFVLFSAGPDGIYFSKVDGPGENKDTRRIGESPSITEFISDLGPRAFDDFDDIRVFGGG